MTTKRLLLLLSGTAATVAVVAGCSSGNAAAPTSIPAPSPSAASLPHDGAPKVEHPLPASVLSGDPCQDALTSDQLKQILGSAPQGKRDDNAALGRACNWDADAGVGVGYDTQTHEGLSGVYANTKPQASVWHELKPIQGFPAAAHSSEKQGAAQEFCQVSVGIRDDLSFDASLYLSQANIGVADPCELAARVADMVVTNLRQKAGG
ncbi:DUF3558 domain-containing protein [Amycolatopsis sp. NPDC050768]|uniref:DUF3558 domain-containing protein n=1 Tax=Amycolatopsis sp. NPDC050768 TaxID=3154839 RepID=UPI0033F4E984